MHLAVLLVYLILPASEIAEPCNTTLVLLGGHHPTITAADARLQSCFLLLPASFAYLPSRTRREVLTFFFLI